MADIRPFHGIHYNPSRVKDLTEVICPPYDIITPRMQQELYQSGDYNFVRIEFGRELPADRDTNNKYTRAASFFRTWLEQGMLVADGKPSIYVDDHHFSINGKACRRRSISCLVKLEDWNKMIVRPHEGTLSKAKSDRLSMLWALEADTSPIMALYEDPDKTIPSLLTAPTRKKPSLTASKKNGESHRLWIVDDDKIIDRIRDSLTGRPLYIADGHHRYESALTYRRERRSTFVPGKKEEPFDFVMMTLVDIADPGLVILPAHRLVRGMSRPALDGLFSGLKTFFKIKEVPLDTADIRPQIDGLLAGNKDGGELILYGLKDKSILVLSLNKFDVVRHMFPAFHSDIYQRLDVSIVDHIILEELLGLTHEVSASILDYIHDAPDAIKKVQEGEYQLALIVSPVRPAVIKAIADIGDRMPRKSTYFYPKVPAGLVSYSFI